MREQLLVKSFIEGFPRPGDVDEMLETILPKFEPSMDQILATQTFLVHFLPISHCQMANWPIKSEA
jgi:proteasome activator subunit 4